MSECLRDEAMASQACDEQCERGVSGVMSGRAASEQPVFVGAALAAKAGVGTHRG